MRGAGPQVDDYPDDAADLIEARAWQRFGEAVEKYGAGQNWREEPPGGMLQCAQEKVLEAHGQVKSQNPELAVEAMADAINYIRFEADARLNVADCAEQEADADD